MSLFACPHCGVVTVGYGDEYCEKCFGPIPPGFGGQTESVFASGYTDPMATVPVAAPPPPPMPAPAPGPSVPSPLAANDLGLLCLSCQSFTPQGAEACKDCGTPLEVPCATCGAKAPIKRKFCPVGGNKCKLVAESMTAALIRPLTTGGAVPPPAVEFALVLLDPRGHEIGRFPLRPGDNEVGIESPGDNIFPHIDLTPHDPDEVISRRMIALQVDGPHVSMVVRTNRGTVQLDGVPLAQGQVVDLSVGADLRFAHLTARIVAQ